MIHLLSALVTILLLWWLPLWGVAAVVGVYQWWWRGYEILVAALVIDWYLTPNYPWLTLTVTGVSIFTWFLRDRFMPYTE
jgi:hypothetical protein